MGNIYFLCKVSNKDKCVMHRSDNMQIVYVVVLTLWTYRPAEG